VVKDGGKQYHHWILTLTNESTGKNKPEVHLNGGHHGDEPISVEAAYYFAEWMLERYDTDDYVRFLIDEREIYIMPLVNPYGWVHDQREDKNGIDINRDYPYDVKAGENPLMSVGANAVYRLTESHRFIISISWHSVVESISYSWGCPAHNTPGDESPDDRAFSSVAKVMSSFGGPKDEPYKTGPNNKILSSVNGAWDDYSYAASWDRDVAHPNFESGGAASLSFTVEISRNKKPSEEKLGSNEDILHRDEDGGGYLPRNFRIALAVVDLAQPYIKVDEGSIPEEIDGGDRFNISWLVGGCTSVNETKVVLSNDGVPAGEFSPMEGVGIWEKDTDYSKAPWERRMFSTEVIIPDAPGNYTIYIEASVDDELSSQDAPDPNTGPKSYFVNMRTNEGWSEDSPNASIIGREIWSSGVASFTVDDNDTDPFDDLLDDGAYNGDGGLGDEDSENGSQSGPSKEDTEKEMETVDYIVVAIPFIVILVLLGVWLAQKMSVSKK